MCGGSNPVQDLVSSVSDTLASIDPGPSIGSGLAELDKGVNNAIPGGWITVAALTAGGLALAYAPEVMAFAEANGITPAAASTELGIAPVNAVTGEVVTPDVFAGLSANAPVDTSLSQAAAASMPTAAATTATPGASAILNAPDVSVSLAPPSSGTFGSISAPLSGSGAIPGAGAVTSAEGLTGALPGGVLVGDGTGGTVMGATYIDAGGGVPALDMFGNPVQASSIGIGGIDTSSGLSLSDLNNARRAYNLAKGLTSSGSSGFSLSPYTTLGSDSSGSGGTIQNVVNKAAPKATMIQGQQIQSQMPTGLENPVQTAAVAQPALNPLADLQLIQSAANGGYMQHMALGGLPMPMSDLRMKGRQTGFGVSPHGANLVANILGHREGGEIEGHNPTFFSVGGLNSLENTYVQGEGDGTSDDVAAMLADGEFVIPADVVSKIGNGSSNAGAKVLDQFLETVREHAQNHDPKDLPPTSKGPLAYLQEAKRKVDA